MIVELCLYVAIVKLGGGWAKYYVQFKFTLGTSDAIMIETKQDKN
jgi:hypothetical protein